MEGPVTAPSGIFLSAPLKFRTWLLLLFSYLSFAHVTYFPAAIDFKRLKNYALLVNSCTQGRRKLREIGEAKLKSGGQS